jgi:LacI family transcriptional regulator
MDGQAAEPARRARIVDVADLAKVSRATAARVIGGYGLVSDATRQRVLGAAEALDYRTNELARAMRAGRSSTLGLVIANLSDSFFDRAARAIIDAAADSDYQVLVIDTHDSVNAEARAVRVLVEKRVDGLIVVPSSPVDESSVDSGVPTVFLDRSVSGSLHPSVTTDDRASAADAVRMFEARGHRQLGMLVSSVADHSIDGLASAISPVADRVMGFLDACGELNLLTDSHSVRFSSSDHDAAKRVAMSMLAREPRPTAILTSNAEMALAVIDACTELGLHIGTDVSLITFDDSLWTRVFAPRITVIRRPVAELAKRAVSLLLGKLVPGSGYDNSLQVESIQLPNELIERESVAMVPARA